MSRAAAVVVALSLPLLAACGGDEPKSAPSNLTPSSAAESEGAPESLTKKFGETFTWDDDVAITMSKPKPFTSGSDALQPNEKGVVLDVTVKNGSEQPVAIQGDVTMEPLSDGQETTPIQDKSAGVDLPEDPVEPGKSVKFKVAFSPGDDLTVKVTHGYGNAEGKYEE